MSDQTTPGILELTATIVSAHVSNNPLEAGAIPGLIQSVYRSLSTAGNGEAAGADPEPAKAPAVPIKKSVFPDYIVCLEDGRKLKMLRRHLHTSYGLTPEAYRAKWKLPVSYPMVAPNYAAHRSTLARSSGLGRKPAEAPASAEPVVTQVRARRARGAKG